jgi:hypothetical protein
MIDGIIEKIRRDLQSKTSNQSKQGQAELPLTGQPIS